MAHTSAIDGPAFLASTTSGSTAAERGKPSTFLLGLPVDDLVDTETLAASPLTTERVRHLAPAQRQMRRMMRPTTQPADAAFFPTITVLEDVDDADAAPVSPTRERAPTALPERIMRLLRALRDATDVVEAADGGVVPGEAIRAVSNAAAALTRGVSVFLLHELDAQRRRADDEEAAWIGAGLAELSASSSDAPKWLRANTQSAGGKGPAPPGRQAAVVRPPKSLCDAAAMLGARSLSTMYNTLDALLHSVGCDRGSVFVPDDAGHLVSCVLVGAGGIARPIRVHQSYGVVGEVFRSGTAINARTVRDAAGDAVRNVDAAIPYFEREVDSTTGYYTRTLLAMPIFSPPEARTLGASAESDSATPRRVLGVVELLNKLRPSPVSGVFSSEDETLLAHVATVFGAIMASCGGVVNFAGDAATAEGARLQARLLATRPATMAATQQTLTATAAGCDASADPATRFSYARTLQLQDAQRAKERRLDAAAAAKLGSADVQLLAGVNEAQVEAARRRGGTATRILRLGLGGGATAQPQGVVESMTLADVTAFIGRIEGAWSDTRTRCARAESDAALVRKNLDDTEAQLRDYRRLANDCGLLEPADIDTLGTPIAGSITPAPPSARRALPRPIEAALEVRDDEVRTAFDARRHEQVREEVQEVLRERAAKDATAAVRRHARTETRAERQALSATAPAERAWHHAMGDALASQLADRHAAVAAVAAEAARARRIAKKQGGPLPHDNDDASERLRDMAAAHRAHVDRVVEAHRIEARSLYKDLLAPRAPPPQAATPRVVR